jgi:hypothetical protein
MLYRNKLYKQAIYFASATILFSGYFPLWTFRNNRTRSTHSCLNHNKVP